MHDIDFLPSSVRAQRSRRRRRFRQINIAVIVAALLILGGVARQQSVSAVQQRLDAVESEVHSIQSQVALREQLEREWSELLRKQEIDSHLGSRLTARDVLAELGNLLPESMALSTLTLETTTEVGGRNVRRRIRLTITGLAPSDVQVANFVGRMSASPLFDDVSMGYAKQTTVQGRIGREFLASCYVAK